MIMRSWVVISCHLSKWKHSCRHSIFNWTLILNFLSAATQGPGQRRTISAMHAHILYIDGIQYSIIENISEFMNVYVDVNVIARMNQIQLFVCTETLVLDLTKFGFCNSTLARILVILWRLLRNSWPLLKIFWLPRYYAKFNWPVVSNSTPHTTSWCSNAPRYVY